MVTTPVRRQTFQPGIPDVEGVIALEKAPPQDEPDLTLEWLRFQMSTEGAMGEFRNFRQECEKVDSFVLGEFNFSTAASGTKIRLGTAQSVVKAAVVHVTPPFLDITVPAPGTRGASRAERIQKFLHGASHMREQQTPTRRVTAQHMAMYGVAFEKTEFAAARWGEFPEPPAEDAEMADYKEKISEILDKRDIHFPISDLTVNPTELLWDTANGSDPRWVIWETDISARWVKAHFPQWAGAERGDVKFSEIWTKSQVAYVADQQWAMPPRDHGYGDLNWTMYWPQTGFSLKGNRPEHLYRGMLHGNFEMIEGESALASHYIDIVRKAAWPPKDFIGPVGITADVIAKYEEGPDAKNAVPPNVEIRSGEVPEPSQTIIVAKDMLSAAIESNTAPAVVRGERPSGAASGYETSILSGIAGLNFGPLLEAAQRGLQKRNELTLRIIEHVIMDRVTVWGMTEAGPLDATIKPSEIRGHYVNVVKLNPTSPEEAERKLNLWSQLWRSEFVDLGTAHEKGGITNSVEVRSKIAAERFMRSETVQGLLDSEAAKRIPILSEILQAASGGVGTASEADEIASTILNTQNAPQLPNAGSFGLGNQASAGSQTDVGVPQQTRPVMPGSASEADLISRQVSSPARSGNRRVPTSDLPPGLG